LAELHIWSTGAGACVLEMRQTQPNSIRPRAELQASGQFLRLEPMPLPSAGFELHLSGADMQRLAVSPPNWAGNFLVIDILHTLHEANELRYWGWTYRLLRDGRPLADAANADGVRLSLDADGWLVWPRLRRDFGEVVAVIDSISLELHT